MSDLLVCEILPEKDSLPSGFAGHCPEERFVCERLRAIVITRLFLRGPDGIRPADGKCEKLLNDPFFREYVTFSEYFHGDTGAGLGASHQTGWIGPVAKLLQPRRK